MAAALLAAACGTKKGDEGRIAPVAPVTVKVRTAAASDAAAVTGFVGTVSSAHTASIQARLPGTLKNLYVKEGQRVKEGDPLAFIESQAVQSAYESASSRLAQAEDGWKRIQEVHADGSVTEVEYVRVRTQVEEARAAEKAARRSLEDCTLKAPFPAIVEKVHLSRGVEVSPGETILRILDPGSLEVHFSLPENEFGKYREGMAARVVIPALGKTLDATLTTKGVAASALSHSYDCTLSLRGSLSGVMPGMVCKVYLEDGSVSERILPAAAVKTDMEGRYVWVVDAADTVRKRHIVVDGYGKEGIVVSDGLQDTDCVITEGARKVSAGMKGAVLEE